MERFPTMTHDLKVHEAMLSGSCIEHSGDRSGVHEVPEEGRVVIDERKVDEAQEPLRIGHVCRQVMHRLCGRFAPAPAHEIPVAARIADEPEVASG